MKGKIMAKCMVILIKVRTQRFETVIDQETDDPDEMADKAWEKFNSIDPDVKTEYTTHVSKIDQTSL